MSGIEHLVLVQWAATTSEAERERIRELARGLADTIPGILHVTEGPSVSPEGLESGFEWALRVRFDGAESRDAYLPHPAHRPLADAIGAASTKVLVFDIADVPRSESTADAHLDS